MKKLWMVLCVAGMVLAACGPGGEETATPVPAPTKGAAEAVATQPAPKPTDKPAEVARTTVRIAISDWEEPIYADLIKVFEEENPDLRVEVVSVNEVLGLGALGQIEIPDDANQRLVAAADVVEIDVSRQTVQEGLVRDLTPLIEADPKFQTDDFYVDALKRFQWDGGTWALPTQLSIRLMFYDKDAFDEAGVPYPEAGWSWDDLLVKAQALTEREDDEVTRWGFVPNGLAYRLVESRVGGLVDDGADPPAPRYDDPAVVEAVRWYADLYRKHQVMPYFEPEEEEGGALSLSQEQAFIDQGQAAMWPDIDVLWWLRKEQGNIGVAPLPADAPDWPATPFFVGQMAISAGTAVPEPAWRLVEFLSRQTVSGLTMGMKFLPARRSAGETGDYWDDLDAGLADALRYALDHGYVAGEPVSYDAFDEALNAILSGEQEVEDALAEAQTRAEAEVAEAALTQAAATPVPTFVVSPGEETPAAEGASTITFAPGLGSLNLEPYRALADQFHEQNPDIVVNVKMADFMGGTPDQKSMAAASDCFEWYPSLQDAEQRAAILNLKPFLDADPSFSVEDFYPQVLERFTYQGQPWGLPADITPFVFEYNQELFDAAGLDYPAADWTWDDFLATTVALTEGEGEDKQYGFVAEVYELNDLLLITERLGAKLIDDSVDPPALSLNDPDTVKAVRWYAGLTTEHGVKPTFVTDLSNLLGASTAMVQREGLINSGQAAIWTSSPATAAVFGEREGIQVGVAALPARADGASSASILATSGYFISSDTENREACWRWITYLTGQPAAVQGLPARRSLAESDEFRQKVGADRADAYLGGVGEAEAPSAFQLLSDEEWLGGAIFWYGQAFGQILEGEASVEDALDAAQKLADDYRACVVAGDDLGQEAWQACAKEVDPTLPDYLFPSGQ